jgi:hypothetical protein
LFKQIPSVSSEFSGLIVATMYRAILLLIALIGGLVYLSSRTDVQPVDEPPRGS